MKDLIDLLYDHNYIEKDQLLRLLNGLIPYKSDAGKHHDIEAYKYLIIKADEKRRSIYGTGVFMRGLVEFTSYCKRNCMYCGLRAANTNLQRYRLDKEQIVKACSVGWELGYRTFVLQGGEDDFYTDKIVTDIITTLKSLFEGCAITLSLGEKPKSSFIDYFKAGADRYLLRHETASKQLYKKLHPDMDFENRIRCLFDLKEIGFQVGAGFMTGLPGQKNEDYVEDIYFLKILKPHMVGIGPFIPHGSTPLAGAHPGTVEDTIILIALTRLFLPDTLIPATTALGSIDPLGRELGLKAGANVVMPNLSPVETRSWYSLYDGKICTGDEAAECRRCIEGRINNAGFRVDMSRGDHVNYWNGGI